KNFCETKSASRDPRPLPLRQLRARAAVRPGGTARAHWGAATGKGEREMRTEGSHPDRGRRDKGTRAMGQLGREREQAGLIRQTPNRSAGASDLICAAA